MTKNERLDRLFKTLLIRWSPLLTGVLLILSAAGFYLGSGVQLKLSLTDLLPDNYPAVEKFEKLTDVVGGVGYFAVVLRAEDGESHLKAAPAMIADLKTHPLVRDAFIDRERRFFVDRMLYYMSPAELTDMEKNIRSQILSARAQVIDLGLWGDENQEKPKEAFNSDMKELARKSAEISPYLTSPDNKDLLLMVKPSFDSTDLKLSEELIPVVESAVRKHLPEGVSYDFGERYYRKVVETKLIQNDIFILGILSVALILLNLFLYLWDWRALVVIFLPIGMALGITMGFTWAFIGHINIITGFLMGILSGLGVDYAIHLYLRLPLERREPTSSDPDPVWRALSGAGHAIFIGALAAAFAFYLLCFSDFRAFSEFGFVCGTGIVAVFTCLMCTFATTTRLLGLDKRELRRAPTRRWRFPVLPLPRGVYVASLLTLALLGLGTQVEFEYDFDRMMRHSEQVDRTQQLIDDIYGRSSTPSAIAAPDKDTAVAVEEMIKEKYMPGVVQEIISGATIIPEQQAEKARIIGRIQDRLSTIKDRWIERSLDVPAEAVRTWVNAKPFTDADLPTHLRDALRGKWQSGYLLYLYPAVNLGTAQGVMAYSAMIRDVEARFPNVLTGSDAVIFSDILDLIHQDGRVVLVVILLAVGLFIWLNLRRWDDSLASYLPLLLAFPVGMGLMYLLGARFNIFNIAIIPAFVAIGIDIPIHIAHRARETMSGFKSVRDLAAPSNLALSTTAIGFGILIFAQTSILRSLGWVAILGTLAIWWVGLIVLPAVLEMYHRRRSPGTTRPSLASAATAAAGVVPEPRTVEARPESPGR